MNTVPIGRQGYFPPPFASPDEFPPHTFPISFSTMHQAFPRSFSRANPGFRHSILTTATLLTACWAIGCGGSSETEVPLSSVTGTVTLDGQPLENAGVQFSPVDVEVIEGTNLGGSSGFAETDADGRYRAQSGRESGLQPGNYLVQISKTSFDDNGSETNAVPDRYNADSDLKIQVLENESNTFDFALESK